MHSDWNQYWNIGNWNLNSNDDGRECVVVVVGKIICFSFDNFFLYKLVYVYMCFIDKENKNVLVLIVVKKN